MIQDIICAYSIICDLKEIAKKRKLDHGENYWIYGNPLPNNRCLL